MVKQAVILAAGLGKRMLPITKIIPKPLLPIGTTPMLDYVVKELEESGIEKIVIVVGYKKEIIQNYYRGNNKIEFVIQDEINGTAPALSLVKSVLDEGPFGICYADDIFDYSEPCLKQLIKVYLDTNAVMVTGIEKAEVSKLKMYNSVSIEDYKPNVKILKQIIEKPMTNFPSNYTSTGRFIVNHEIFNVIDTLLLNAGKELYLTDAFNELMKTGNVYGVEYEGKRYDAGSKEGWLETNVAFNNLKLLD